MRATILYSVYDVHVENHLNLLFSDYYHGKNCVFWTFSTVQFRISL